MSDSPALKRICLVPQARGLGGMVSFRAKFSSALQARGISITHELNDESCDAVLIIGGTRQLLALYRARQRGIPIVQRLDGINWLHRRRWTGPRHYLRAEINNWILKTIRARLATHIVYQSEFVRQWWQQNYGPAPVGHSIIHNGVDLKAFSPAGPEKPPKARFRLLLVEGRLDGGYELGLASAVALAQTLRDQYAFKVQLSVAGRVSPRLRARWDRKTKQPIEWLGEIPNDQIPALNRTAHLLYSADLNAACPNAVIEALASGLPVVAFDTGALKELVTPAAGRLADYGGDPWKLEAPDILALAKAASEILGDLANFRRNARAHAEFAFSLEEMTNAYLKALAL
ncbi:MAG: glycosyltransferase [Chloroflexi bacterium]|nr:glycosyltransferase [Chloroflexota bacterium]